jgi:lambda repressor-like predicted transcriptional regulator
LPPCDTLRAVKAQDWLEEANRYDAQAKQALAEGRVGDAVVLSVRAEAARDAAEKVRRALSSQTKHGKKQDVESAPVDPIALKMSRGRKVKSKLSQAALAHGYTLRSLAAAAGASHAQLSSAHAGRWPIKESVALKIQELTGFAASRKNWPKGWSR